MKKIIVLITAALFVPLLVILNSCNNTNKKTEDKVTDTTKPVKADEPKTKEVMAAEKPAIINIIDTVATKGIVLYIKDSAKTFERISLKLAQIYGAKLAEVLKKNGIKMVGAPMAWYKTTKAPYFFEAGVPVDKKPAKLPNTVFVREMKADSVLVAHFYGPYSLLQQGYDAIKERMKDEKKVSNGMPYEIYAGDPIDATGNPIDPYKVRTDIVFPRK